MNSYDHLLGYNFIEIAKKINTLITKELLKVGITFPQYRVLSRLFISESLTQSELVGILSLTAPTLTPVISLLEKKGWLTRQVDPKDARTKIIIITEEGIQKRHEAFEIVMAFETNRLDILPANDSKQLLTWLNHINTRLEEV